MSDETDEIPETYEPPSAEERQAMDHGETMPGVSVIHGLPLRDERPLSDAAIKRIEAAQTRREQHEIRVEKRREETRRETALHLAVQWTATAEEVPLGAVFGISDLMIRYIETGKKPTETEFDRAVKPFRK